jgi:hypothetical protein
MRDANVYREMRTVPGLTRLHDEGFTSSSLVQMPWRINAYGIVPCNAKFRSAEAAQRGGTTVWPTSRACLLTAPSRSRSGSSLLACRVQERHVEAALPWLGASSQGPESLQWRSCMCIGQRMSSLMPWDSSQSAGSTVVTRNWITGWCHIIEGLERALDTIWLGASCCCVAL